ncbi:MAG: hypothetical protein CL563_01200 [Alphaproteobacteria bacterium]|nr:hypothetical protein [Alphaproteobacteria bacterium]MEC8726615.1 BLUF domain-containing protein [Pseudomonadota bacterium]|tara:strand:- start:45 stop:476 length:432 start_codon:yes stop_codon:yes gene_type:complete
MQEDFIQLLYLSNAKPELKQAELDRILEVSRKNNPSRDITGLLVFANGVFIQVLEGPSSEVTNLFETICDDTRHQEVAMLGEYVGQERIFSKWSMGFLQSTFDELTRITDSPNMIGRDDVLSLLSNDETEAVRFLKKFTKYVE